VLKILEVASRLCTIASAARDVLALLGCRADASTTAAEGRTAALGLALIVLEDEQGVITGLKLRAHELLIGSRVAPCANAILRHHILRVKVANGLVAFSIATRILKHVIREAFASRTESTGSVVHHQNIGCEQDNEACDKETETHDSSLLKDFFRSSRVYL
jgi:hypothetical protein